jgi:hypothetical protein
MKNRRKHYIIFMIIAILLTGCSDLMLGPGLSEYEYDVGDKYKLITTSAHQVVVIPKDQTLNSNLPRIEAKVTKIAWDEKFIIVEQLGFKRKYPDKPNNTYMEPDESKVSYWILNVEESKIFGPFSKDEFVKQREGLKVSLKLELKDTKYYKKKR